MTATPSIDLPVWMAEQLSQASPDLLRQMVQTFAEALMSADADAVCGAGYGQRSPDGATPATATGSEAGTLGLAASILRSRSCVQGPIFRTGCWSGAGEPSRRWSVWSPPPICSVSRRGGWRSWSSSWGSPGCQSLGSARWRVISTARWRRSAADRWMLGRTPSSPPTRWC
jgi:hypothetical protein